MRKKKIGNTNNYYYEHSIYFVLWISFFSLFRPVSDYKLLDLVQLIDETNDW